MTYNICQYSSRDQTVSFASVTKLRVGGKQKQIGEVVTGSDLKHCSTLALEFLELDLFNTAETKVITKRDR
jgi:hypothetical protein